MDRPFSPTKKLPFRLIGMLLRPDEKFHTSEPVRILGTINTIDGLKIYMVPEADYDKYQRWAELEMNQIIRTGETGEQEAMDISGINDSQDN